MRSPHAGAVKKYMYDLLQDRYPKHEKFIDRMIEWMQTNEDVEGWSALAVDLFELGFLKAVKEYREQVEKMGYSVNVVPQQQAINAPPIFPQSEKSG